MLEPPQIIAFAYVFSFQSIKPFGIFLLSLSPCFARLRQNDLVAIRTREKHYFADYREISMHTMRQARLPCGREGSHVMPLLEEKHAVEIVPSLGDDSESKQRRQMLVALALLLAALILVLIKDRDFWFPPDLPAQSESEPVEEPSSDVKAPSETVSTATPPQRTVHSRPKSNPHAPPQAAEPRPAPPLAPDVMTHAVLPPLEVEGGV
jgi:hypothetical protein